MTNGDGKIEDDESHFRREATEQHYSDVLHWSVEHILHPVVTQVRCESHFFDRVVNFVKTPQDRDSVKKDVGNPLYEVRGDKKDQQLAPKWKAAQVDERQLTQAASSEIHEHHLHHIREGNEDDQFKNVEVEEHVEGVEPEVLANN